MILHVPHVLNGEQVAHCRDVITRSKWVDGRLTAGPQFTLAEDRSEARELGEVIVAALERQPLFISAALPLRVFPPIFNRYDAGMSFGTHLDNSIRQITGTPYRVRTDIAATLFLSQPDEYDGGELVIDDVYGAHAVKLPAGEAVECLLRALEVDPRHRDAPDHLVDVLHALIDELVQIGLGDGFLSPQPGEKFDHYNRHRRTREIGALIAMMGDRGAVTMDGRALPRAQLMTLVIHCVGKKMKDYRTSHNLKFAWDGMDGEGQTPHV